MTSQRFYLTTFRARAVDGVVHQFDVDLVISCGTFRVTCASAPLARYIHQGVPGLLKALNHLVGGDHRVGSLVAPRSGLHQALRASTGDATGCGERDRPSMDSARVPEGTAFAGTSMQAPGRARVGQL